MTIYANIQKNVDMDWVDKAGYHFESCTDLDASAAEVFAILEDGDAWCQWFEGMTAVNWLTPEPKGVGTQRTVSLGSTNIEEHFLVWEQGTRMAFRFTSSNSSVFSAIIEDYRLEDMPGGGGRCRFVYKVHADFSTWASFIGCILKVKLNSMFGNAGPNLARYVSDRVKSEHVRTRV
jgi:hypothetical protein